jgi:integrase
MTRIKLKYVHAYTDVRGKLRRYFRRPGFKKIVLPGLPGSTEFMAAYEQALAGLPRKEIGADRTRPGTVNAAIVGYYQCLAFRELAPSTQAKRRGILERFRAKHGDKRVATLPQEFIRRELDQMKPGEARNWLKALRGLLDFAAGQNFRADNPARGFVLPKMKTKNRRAWTDPEIEQYERAHQIGSKARLAFALGLFTIQRLGDVIRMGRQHIRNGELVVRQGKTGAQLTLPIRPELQAILDATPSEHMTFLVTGAGRPYGGADFSGQFRAWCDEAGLPKGCTFHGLRATGCTKLADNGCSAHEIAAWSGPHDAQGSGTIYEGGQPEAACSKCNCTRGWSVQNRNSQWLTYREKGANRGVCR